MDNRQQQLSAWLQQVLAAADFKLSIASADASFRRYFRVHLADKTWIAMDAPPAQEDSASFVKVATMLFAAGLNVPEVIKQDLEQGFLLLTDLGDDTYFAKLNADNAPMLYGQATDALIKLQLAGGAAALPKYDAAMLNREMQLFPDWYVAKHLNLTLTPEQQAVLDKTFDLLTQNILAQAQVAVHRDYHSRNLMLSAHNNPGILDFQDAVCGAISYDLVSLLKDAYIGWDEEQIIDWAVRYWQPAKKAGLPVPDDFSEFYRNFEWVGAQRHIKVLGIFARLSHRDGKNSYLQDLPLVMAYLRKVCERYVELRPMLRLLNQLEQSQPQVGYSF